MGIEIEQIDAIFTISYGKATFTLRLVGALRKTVNVKDDRFSVTPMRVFPRLFVVQKQLVRLVGVESDVQFFFTFLLIDYLINCQNCHLIFI